ncbi:MAG: class I SAM-dependent methyltransferase, partial [Planctomycetota bacterium]
MVPKLSATRARCGGLLPLGILLLSVTALNGADSADKGPERDSAREILEATGVAGGLVVHLGCGNGRLTAALCANDGFLVQGLDRDAKNVDEAREHIRSLGLYGQVTADRLSGTRLPYVDNLVNLVVAEDLDGVSKDELLRVLCPNGVAYVKEDGRWAKTVKPRPPEIDQWTHCLHDATNNPVAHDPVGPPRRLQWVGSPRWSRHHDNMSSVSAVVSTGGRVFYIFDEGSRSSIF